MKMVSSTHREDEYNVLRTLRAVPTPTRGAGSNETPYDYGGVSIPQVGNRTPEQTEQILTELGVNKISSWVVVHGHNQAELDWMSSNYRTVRERVEEIAPTLGGDGLEEVTLGLESQSQDLRSRYYWRIDCNRNSSGSITSIGHIRTVAYNIRTILSDLEAPEGLEIYLSPDAQWP